MSNRQFWIRHNGSIQVVHINLDESKGTLTGPLRFTYYLDAKLPKPEEASETKEIGYGYEIRGAIPTPSGGNLQAGAATVQDLGFFFGASVARPERGNYKFKIRIRTSSGNLLYEGVILLRV